ncbi:thrombospondin-4-like [Uranotaenia lowii]|uniref:thrombospondin-4-like n=1 Tax=Uranotaenia lowii TaxID=190385 RepID=UPI002479AF54|nr:thrombospondin-4-like [Uranotaenia lowii]
MAILPAAPVTTFSISSTFRMPSPLLFLAILLLATTMAKANVANLVTNPGCHYGDLRDHYFGRPLQFADPERLLLQERDLPAPLDRCRMAKEMEQEIHYLRTVLDKCTGCDSSVTQISRRRSGRTRPEVGHISGHDSGDAGMAMAKCRDHPCRHDETGCTETGRGIFCGPCPVGYEGNGLDCVAKQAC